LFAVSAKPEESLIFGGSAAMNCYLPMPFARRILIELVNENDLALATYFHVDYELYRQPLAEDVMFLHAAWRREDPCDGWGPDLQVNSPEANIPNLDGAGNYVDLWVNEIVDGRGRWKYDTNANAVDPGSYYLDVEAPSGTWSIVITGQS
jgi:hypothetical protein